MAGIHHNVFVWVSSPSYYFINRELHCCFGFNEIYVDKGFIIIIVLLFLNCIIISFIIHINYNYVLLLLFIISIVLLLYLLL